MTHDVPVLRDLLLLAGVALTVLLLFRRLRLPAAVGFIVTGVLIGPGAFRLVEDAGLVRTLAEFGVMFLLFTVGLEFSREDLRRMGRAAIVGGALQVGLTMTIVAGALVVAGLHPAVALFVGMLASLSSTALVLRLLTDRLELTAPHGRLATGVLIFQDLMVIPFAIAVPWLARWHSGADIGLGGPSMPILETLAQLAAVGLIFALAHRVAPWLLGQALRTRSREVFLFGVVAVALGSAYLTSRLGLSLALGAFLAGLVLAESELRSHIEAGVVSFRDALSSVFFVTIGMLLEPRALIAYPLIVLASTLGMVVLKAAVAAIALRAGRASWRVSLAGGVTLAQVGEFSFMLAQAAPASMLGEVGGQAFYAGAVFSLLLTPWFVNRAAEWAHVVEERRARLARRGGEARGARAPQDLSHHVVIAGFGLNGQNLARVLRSVRLPHVVVDLDPEVLQSAPAEGSPVVFGDITRPEIQQLAGLPRARVLVLALSDPVATRHACRIARSISPGVFVIVRTRYVAEIDELYRLGANQVIPEEFETSIEIFTATLRHFHIPSNVIQAQVQLLREERYSLLRGLRLPSSVIEQLDSILQQGTCDTFILLQHSPAIGRSLPEFELEPDEPVADGGAPGTTGEAAGAAPAAGDRRRRGARAVAVVRGGAALQELGPDLRLQVGDILVLTGTHAEMEEAFQRLTPTSVG